jgi:hypothetical protein
MLSAEKILLAFANRDCALEPDHAPDKLRRRSRVQPELVDNFDFLAHTVQSGGLESAFVAIRASSMKAPIVTPSTKSDSK